MKQLRIVAGDRDTNGSGQLRGGCPEPTPQDTALFLLRYEVSLCVSFWLPLSSLLRSPACAERGPRRSWRVGCSLAAFLHAGGLRVQGLPLLPVRSSAPDGRLVEAAGRETRGGLRCSLSASGRRQTPGCVFRGLTAGTAMRDLPRPGIKPVCPALPGRFLTAGPPRASLLQNLKIQKEELIVTSMSGKKSFQEEGRRREPKEPQGR